jgi:hypothetical protein
VRESSDGLVSTISEIAARPSGSIAMTVRTDKRDSRKEDHRLASWPHAEVTMCANLGSMVHAIQVGPTGQRANAMRRTEMAPPLCLVLRSIRSDDTCAVRPATNRRHTVSSPCPEVGRDDHVGGNKDEDERDNGCERVHHESKPPPGLSGCCRRLNRRLAIRAATWASHSGVGRRDSVL